MLYLLRSYTKDGSILKVGYASGVEFRISQYSFYNPGIEKIKVREGGRDEETLIHTYLHFLGYGSIRDEWYVDRQETIQEFSADFDKVKEIIWENRDSIFPENCFSLAREAKWKKLYEITKPAGIIISGRVDKKYSDRYNRKFAERSSSNEEINKIIDQFNSLHTFIDRMKYLVGIRELINNEIISLLPEEFAYYWNLLGPDKIKAYGCQKSKLDAYSSSLSSSELVRDAVLEKFLVGEKIELHEIKRRLSEIYGKFKKSEKAKASDLEEYFVLKECKITNKETGKRDRAYEIIKKK